MIREPPVKYEACSRSSYTHRKQKKSVKELFSSFQKDKKIKSKMNIIEEEEKQKQTPMQKQSQIPNVQPAIQKRFKGEEFKESKSENKISAIIIKTPFKSRDHFAHKLRLMFPSGYSLDILRRLVYAGAKAIGMKEYKAINSECKEFNFPQDFPLTKAGIHHSYKQAQLSLLKYCRLPPRKRFDYFKAGFAMPFRSEWKNLKIRSMEASQNLKLLPCIITCIGRGVVSKLAYIYLRKEDVFNPTTELASKQLMKALVIQFIKTKTQQLDVEEQRNQEIKKELKKIPLSKHDQEQIQKQSISQNIALNKDLTLSFEGQAQTDQRIIGFVTSGGYSLREGKSVAKGWILADCKITEGIEVFVRNPRGRKVIEGKVQILKSIKGTRLY